MVEKLVRLLEDRGISQAAFERSTLLSANRISKWKGGTGEATASEALRIARALRVSFEWLADDAAEWPPREEITADEARLLWAIRALRLDAEEALRLINQASSAPPALKSTIPQKPDVTQTSAGPGNSSPKRGAR